VPPKIGSGAGGRPVTVETSWPAVEPTVPTVESAAVPRPFTAPADVTAEAAWLAVSGPMPKATHRPPITASQVYRNTFRAS